jgi:hypothetical protein
MLNGVQGEPHSMLGLRRRFGLALGFGISGLVVFCAAQVINYYREPWLGVVQRNAAHNFAFNLSFYIPATLLCSGLALISVIFYFRSLRTLRSNDSHPSLWERATILPALPVLLFDAVLALFITLLVMS